MLKSLELENFRNYSSLKMPFSGGAGLTYLIGDNGQGKTNLLEAIYMLALAKSFRISDDLSLIKWDAEFGRVKGSFGDSEGNVRNAATAPSPANLEVFLGRPPQPRRAFKVNDVKVAATSFVGKVRVVFFHPENLNVLYLGPDLRRRYLDILILQKSPRYFNALRKFKRVRAQRNALLTAINERKAGEEDLEIWDEQLIEEGVVLWRERALALAFINENLSEKYREISQQGCQLEVKYVNGLGLNYNVMLLSNNLEELYREGLFNSRGRDIASGHTQLGPHRDDFEIFLDGRSIITHASRGEFRTILLALKLIEMDYFSEDGVRPILLLDDVFSELDYERQRFLLERVVDFQTFIATTKDSAVINRENLLGGDFVEIVDGEVRGDV